MYRALAAFALLLACSPAFSQVIYQPVQYQFSLGSGDQHYFYGGNNPRVHAAAHFSTRAYYPNNQHNFDGGNSFGQTSLLNDRSPVFTDCVPFRDASRIGFTEADAHNEAYANAARYYRKSDELAAAIPTADGALIVPPTPVCVAASADQLRAAVPHRGEIIIIPKRLLDQPLKNFTNPPAGKVASTN